MVVFRLNSASEMFGGTAARDNSRELSKNVPSVIDMMMPLALWMVFNCRKSHRPAG